MKKLLLSLAVAAMAMPAMKAQTFNDILGIYSGTYLGYDVNNDYETYDGFLDYVEIEAGDAADEVLIYDLFPEIPGSVVTATYDESTHILTLPEQTLAPDRYLVMFDWDINDWAYEVEFDVASDGTITMVNPSVEFYVIDDSWNYYMNNAEIVLYLEEHTGNQPGEEPGEEPGDEPSEGIKIVPGIDTGDFYKGGSELQDPWPYTGTFLGITGNCFLVGKWESFDGELSINATSNDDPGSGYNNNLWYFENDGFAFSGNPSATVDNPYIYTFIAGEGYVIKDIHFEATPSLTATVDQIFVYEGDEYVAKVGAAPIEIDLTDINEQEVWLGLVGQNQGVMVSDLYIVLVEEGSSAVKGLESVDAEAPVVFYDLQGRKVANPSNGIFIRQQGDKTSKVVVR